MDFTPEQRAYIDWKLKRSDERQKNGNKTYTIEELKKEFAKPKSLRGFDKNRLQAYR